MKGNDVYDGFSDALWISTPRMLLSFSCIDIGAHERLAVVHNVKSNCPNRSDASKCYVCSKSLDSLSLPPMCLCITRLY
jgi:hypothetical protein